VGNILGRGVFAAFSQVQDDIPAFRRVWLDNIQRIALLAVPTLIATVLLAEPIVVTLLGEKWRPVIVPLQILALGGLARAFSATSGEVFQAEGRPHRRLWIEGFRLVVMTPMIVVGAHVGEIEGVAAAVALSDALVAAPALLLVTRSLDVRARDLAMAVARPAVGWLVLAIVLAIARPLSDGLSPALALVTLVAVGAAAYVATISLVARDLVRTMWVSLRGANAPGR
jgi:PST family polysaccharide transporter